jgi:ribonuclease P protein component
VTERLGRDADVRRALRTGQQRSGRLLSLHAVTQDPLRGPTRGPMQGPTRLTVVASRRVGNAVRRNRAKRLLREAARVQSWRPALDIVLVARTACADSDLDHVVAELAGLGGRLDVLARPDR